MLLFTAELGYNFLKFWGEEGKGFSLFFRTNVGYVPQEKFQQIQFLLHFSAYNFSSAVILNNISGQMDDYGLF